MRVLAITKIFPNRVAPLDAPYMSLRYASLLEQCTVDVLATIPWFPGASLFRRWSRAGQLTSVPDREVIRGLQVWHPRFLFVPKVAFPVQWLAYAAAVFPHVLARRRHLDVILATWAYPDAVAAIVVGEQLGIPVIAEVIGSDINELAQRLTTRVLLRRFLPRASRLIAVSRPLAASVARLGVPPERIDVIPTGVDRGIFHPRDQSEARRRLLRPSEGRSILYVGRLDPRKGVFDLLNAFAKVKALDGTCTLVVVGSGSAEAEVRRRAAELGDRVVVVGERPLAEVADWLAACDVLALPSWNEGTPNVVLEALSCGRRVVATRVGGIPDVVTTEIQGALVDPGDVEGLAHALTTALRTPYDPLEVSRADGVLGLSEAGARIVESLKQARDDHRRARSRGRLL
jgi:glycosyltransferase involved in cell wall biosynthesis